MPIAKKRFLIFLLYGFLGFISWNVVGSLGFASNFKMVKNLTIPMEESYPGSVISWGGTIDIDGSLKGSIILLGGSMELDGVVEEDVICVASQVRLGEHVNIKGDLFIIGGNLNRHPKSTITGEYFNFKFDIKKIESTLIPIFSDSYSITIIQVVKILLWFILALIVLAVVPKQINHAQEIFAAHTLKIGILGILSLLIFIFLLFAFIVLSFVIIGLPFLFLLIIAYFLIYIFGRTVIFYFIGIKLSGLLKLNKVAPVLFIVIGIIIYSSIKFIPVIGPMILIVLNLFEVGIGIGFLFRKKLKLQA